VSSGSLRLGFIDGYQRFIETCCLNPEGNKDGNNVTPKRRCPPTSFVSHETIKCTLLSNCHTAVTLTSNSEYNLARTFKIVFLTNEIPFCKKHIFVQRTIHLTLRCRILIKQFITERLLKRYYSEKAKHN
jgi:hypothetical protein